MILKTSMTRVGGVCISDSLIIGLALDNRMIVDMREVRTSKMLGSSCIFHML